MADNQMLPLVAGERLFEVRDRDGTTLFVVDAPYFAIADVSTPEGRRLSAAVRGIYGDTAIGRAGLIEVDRTRLHEIIGSLDKPTVGVPRFDGGPQRRPR